jgi:CarD family transcriptional regulator
MFEIGNKVVYPGHGVAVIEEVVKKPLGDTEAEFIKLTFIYKDMVILVPKEQLLMNGVRLLCKDTDVKEALLELHKVPAEADKIRDSMPAGWSKRQKEYQSKLDGGALIDVAVVYRNLRHSSEKKVLSFGEKGLMLAAEDLLSQEVLAVTKMDKGEALKEIREPFEEFCQQDGDLYT